MSKRAKRRVPKTGMVWHLSSEEATLARKPRYNGFACGHGAHGDVKYNRTKSKRDWARDMKKGPHGPFFDVSPFFTNGEVNRRCGFVWHAILPLVLPSARTALRSSALPLGRLGRERTCRGACPLGSRRGNLTHRTNPR